MKLYYITLSYPNVLGATGNAGGRPLFLRLLAFFRLQIFNLLFQFIDLFFILTNLRRME